MRTLITGGAGFIGSHLADSLIARGDHVVILDDLSTGRLENVKHLIDRSDVELIVGSVLDTVDADRATSRVDRVFHLAAAVGVKRIIDRPLESLRINVRGSEIVLVAVNRLRHGRSVVRAGTDHTSHLLIALGLSVWGAIGVMLATTVALGAGALLVSHVGLAPAFSVASLTVVLLATAGIWLSSVPVYADADAGLHALSEIDGSE